jgi:hypothetical protein
MSIPEVELHLRPGPTPSHHSIEVELLDDHAWHHRASWTHLLRKLTAAALAEGPCAIIEYRTDFLRRPLTKILGLRSTNCRRTLGVLPASPYVAFAEVTDQVLREAFAGEDFWDTELAFAVAPQSALSDVCRFGVALQTTSQEIATTLESVFFLESKRSWIWTNPSQPEDRLKQVLSEWGQQRSRLDWPEVTVR